MEDEGMFLVDIKKSFGRERFNNNMREFFQSRM
jgi:hypothetical protein